MQVLILAASEIPTIFWIGLSISAIAVIAILAILLLRKQSSDGEIRIRFEHLTQELVTFRREQQETKAAVSQVHNDSLRQTSESLSKINEQLGALGKSTERIHEVGKDIRSLQDVLQAPKLRGLFGEFLLEDLLRSMLPPDHFQLPCAFRDGSSVDAVVWLSGKKIPIDAKFPLESFRRMSVASEDAVREVARKEFVQSVRVRVNEIADKYIRPEEDTYDFALMYLPSEAIYYEIVVREQDFDSARSPLQYALSRRVIPVSPSSFYAYLATIAFGLRGMQIEKEAEEIRGRVGKLQYDFAAFLEELRKIDIHFDRAKKKFDEALGRGTRLHDRMGQITGKTVENKPLEALQAGEL